MSELNRQGELSFCAVQSFQFVTAVSNGDSNMVRGVYVPEVLALLVQQQPAGDPGFVSSMEGIVTQFEYAAQSGVTGLIAHNYLSGELFFNLEIGQEVFIVYGDGSVLQYISGICNISKL